MAFSKLIVAQQNLASLQVQGYDCWLFEGFQDQFYMPPTIGAPFLPHQIIFLNFLDWILFDQETAHKAVVGYLYFCV